MTVTLARGLLESEAAVANKSPPTRPEYHEQMVHQPHVLQVIYIKDNKYQKRYPYTVLVSDGTHSMHLMVDNFFESQTFDLLNTGAIKSLSIVTARFNVSDNWPFVEISHLHLVEQASKRIGIPSRLRQRSSNIGPESPTPPTSSRSSSTDSSEIGEVPAAVPTAAPAINSSSLLSANFVPIKLRDINEAYATTFFAKLPPPQTFEEVVPFTPRPFISMPDSKLCPIRMLDIDDMIHYALEQRRRELVFGSSVKNASELLSHVDGFADLQDYCQGFEKLLTAERQELALLYERYSQYQHPILVRSKQSALGGELFYTCSIKIPGISDANPPVQIGDMVLLRTMKLVCLPVNPAVGMAGGICRPAVVEIRSTIQSMKRKDDIVQASWLDTQTNNLLNMAAAQAMSTFNVRLVPQATKHSRCLTALDWLSQQPSKFVMPLLFPVSAPIMPSDEVPCNLGATGMELNLHQRDFVKLVLRRTCHKEYQAIRGPVILTGPAGVGKTKTMLAAVLQVLGVEESAHILMCTPSHAAADNIISRLSKHLNRQELFRMYDSSRPIETVPVHVLGFTRQHTTGSGEFCLPSTQEMLSFNVIVCTCDDAHILYRAGLTNQQLRVRRGDFAKYLEKACTACSLTATLKGADSFHYTHLFIDEAAQATEPESLIPLSVVADFELGCRKVEIILVGDPRQLSPSVYSPEAMTAGLGRSWMERLLLRPIGALGGGRTHLLGPDYVDVLDFVKLSFPDSLSIFLTINYRGHPSFLMMPSALFYYDKLQSAVPINGGVEWCEKLRRLESLSSPVIPVLCGTTHASVPDAIRTKKQFGWPIHLRGVKGSDKSVTIQSGFAGNSWQNEEEANAIAEMTAELSDMGVSTQSIGIMAPFRAQVVLIRDLLRRRGLGGVNVGLVEDYQAVERDVILLSLTRSDWSFVVNDIHHRMGMFQQPKRSNVAMTRAQCLFVVVGNPRAMSRDFVWRQFSLFCMRNGLFYGYKGDDDSLQHWNYTSISHRIVSTMADPKQPVGGITLAKGASRSIVHEVNDSLIVVSSLERSFRDK